MSSVKIAWKNLWDNQLSSMLSIILLAVSIAMITFLMNLNRQINNHFLSNIRNIDLVVGASGSPLQTMLSAVYFIDAPTGNISLSTFDRLKKNPLIRQMVPLAYGDNFKGFKIVGTDKSYIDLYDLNIESGKLFQASYQTVVGHNVATTLGLKIGDSFHSSHGMHDDSHVHEEDLFFVSGILQKSGKVADNLILCRMEDVWAVHSQHDENGKASANKEITAILIDLRNPMGMIAIPNLLRNDKSVQVVVPSVEIDRLFRLFGFGREALNALGLTVFILAGLSIFIAMFNSMSSRKYEVALMRSMGGTRAHVFAMVISESLLIGAAGILVGLICGRIGLMFMSSVMESNYKYSINYLDVGTEELLIVPLTFVLCMLAGLIPAWMAMKLDIARVFTNEK